MMPLQHEQWRRTNTPRILEEQTLYKPRQGRRRRVKAWRLTEAQARVRAFHLEAKPSRVAATKLYVAIDRSWRLAGALRTRLHSIITLPWNADWPSSTRNGETDERVSVATDATKPLSEPDLATAPILVAKWWDICTCAQREVHIIHYKATRWIAW